VLTRLQSSPEWQRELEALRGVQMQLRTEMRLLGRPERGQLEALLPDILSQAARGKPGRSPRWSGLQTFVLVSGVLIMILLAPLVLHTSAVDAVGNWQPNVPESTPTLSQHDENTIEGQLVALEAVATEEPSRLHIQLMTDRGGSIPLRQASPISARWEASPVPMPGATAEPSREVPRRR
jgi:hypothetical protein